MSRDASRDRPDHRFEVSTEDGVGVLRLLDSHYHVDSHDALEAQFAEVDRAAPAGLVVVDMTAVTLFASTALRALMVAHKRLSARGGRIVAAGGGELVANYLRFAPFILHYETVEEAKAALRNAA